jgi:ribonuclease HI
VDYSFLKEGSDKDDSGRGYCDDDLPRTGFAVAVKGDEWGYKVEDNKDMGAILHFVRQNPLETRAKLQYRENGTLIVPEIRPFVPPTPTVTPSELFPLQHRPDRQYPRFVRRSSPGDFLIYTDGACLNNGQADPAAGWGFVFRALEANRPHMGRVSGRLEEHGPSGEHHPQTSNRAELRAVIAALQFRSWFGEGWTRLVIATDSEYVTRGATEWVRAWGRNGWVTSNRTAVKNRDLWEELLGEVMGYREKGMEVCFWRIPRAWNEEADRVAKAGARKKKLQVWMAITGVLC